MDTQNRTIASWVREIAAGWPALAAAIVLCVLAALVATAAQPEEYRATGTVLVSPQRFLETEGTDALPALTENVIRLSFTEAILVPAAQAYVAAADSAAERAERRETATLPWLRDHITVREVGQSSVIEISGTAPTQADAQDLTESVVESLTAFVTKARAGGDATDPSSGQALIVLSTGEPKGQVSPSPVRNLLVGINAGLLLGLVLALAFGRQRLRSEPGNVAADLDVPLLGLITPRRSDGAIALRPPQRLLQILQSSDRAVVVLLTGTGSGGRITNFAEELGRALNAGRNRAVLVNGELAGRSRSSLVPPDDRPDPPDLFLSTEPEDPDPPFRHADGDETSTAVFAAGTSDGVPDAAEHARFSSLLDELKDEFDAILVAGPNLSGTPELMALLPISDYCVLITGSWTSQRELAQARVLMQGTRPGATGLVAVRDRPQWLRSLLSP